MIAAELNSADLGKHTVTEMLKHHVVINCTSDTTLRFLPPYIFERIHVDTTIAALDKVFTAYSAQSNSQPASPAQEDNLMASKSLVETSACLPSGTIPIFLPQLNA